MCALCIDMADEKKPPHSCRNEQLAHAGRFLVVHRINPQRRGVGLGEPNRFQPHERYVIDEHQVPRKHSASCGNRLYVSR